MCDPRAPGRRQRRGNIPLAVRPAHLRAAADREAEGKKDHADPPTEPAATVALVRGLWPLLRVAAGEDRRDGSGRGSAGLALPGARRKARFRRCVHKPARAAMEVDDVPVEVGALAIPSRSSAPPRRHPRRWMWERDHHRINGVADRHVLLLHGQLRGGRAGYVRIPVTVRSLAFLLRSRHRRRRLPATVRREPARQGHCCRKCRELFSTMPGTRGAFDRSEREPAPLHSGEPAPLHSGVERALPCRSRNESANGRHRHALQPVRFTSDRP